jgi:hypothetical protein
VFVALTFNSDNPLLLLVVEKDMLDRRVEAKVWLEIEVLSIACKIGMYLSGSGV